MGFAVRTGCCDTLVGGVLAGAAAMRRIGEMGAAAPRHRGASASTHRAILVLLVTNRRTADEIAGRSVSVPAGGFTAPAGATCGGTGERPCRAGSQREYDLRALPPPPPSRSGAPSRDNATVLSRVELVRV